MIAHIEAQGSLLTMKVKGFKPRPSTGGGRRGIIQTFSRGSRLRLMRFMATLKVRKIRATFITLTFREMVSHEEAKRAFKQFSQRIRRSFPMASVVWRLEYQNRRGAIHFHLLCFRLPFWHQAKLQKSWEECTGESISIADVRLVHGARSVMAYVSKYIAKVDDTPTSLDDDTYQHEGEKTCSAGRFWGYINKELLPLGEVFAGVLLDRATIKSISSFAWAKMGGDNPYNSLSFHFFCDNARWLCERAIEEGGCLYSEWEYTVKDHSMQKDWYNTYTGHFSEGELEIIQRPCFGRMSRPSEASSIKPRTWIEKSVRISSFAARMAQEFRNDGIVVDINPLSKEQNHAAI